MSSIVCPHCEKEVSRTSTDYSSWLYDNDLYNAEHAHDVKCPACAEVFWVLPVEVFEYETALTEEDLL